MTAVTQQIPNFLKGISDQPDELKVNGQLKKCQNGYPDLTAGLVKRNGLKYVGELDSTQDAKWFHIEKEDPILGEELYAVSISRAGQVKVWNCFDGTEYEVCYSNDPQFRKRHRLLENPDTRIDESALTCHLPGSGTGSENYFVHTEDQQLQYVTVNDYTFITNRTKFPEMVRQVNNPAYYEAFVEIYQVAAGRSYIFGVYDLDGNSIVEPEYSTATTGQIRSDVILKDWLKDFQETPTETSTTGNGTWVNKGEDPDNTNNNYWELDPQPSSTRTEDRDASTGIITETLVLVTYEPAQATTQSIPKTDPDPTDTPQWTETTTVTKGKIANFFAKIVGQGLYIYSEQTPFVVSTTEEDIINVLSPSIEGIGKKQYYSVIPNASDLPRTAPDGYIVKVINSTIDEDDYYLEYRSGGDVGSGSWQEIAAPDEYTELDVNLMPHQIIRNRVVDTSGSLLKIRFIVSPIDWEPRRAGDNNTNKPASFLPEDPDTIKGRPINNIMFYRNRLVLLSDENVIMSQAGDLFNFWRESMLGLNDSDPIDLNCATNSTAVLYDGLVTNSGLVLFSPRNQFLFTTDSDLLSPRTAKTNVLSSYAFDTNSRPFKLGANIGFTSQSGKNTVMYQMSDALREGEPTVVEQSEVISTIFPGELDIVDSAREIGLVMFGKKDFDEVWIYKYFFDGQRLLQAAWFNWTIPGTLVYHWKTEDVYYSIIRDPKNDKLFLTSHDQRSQLTTGGTPDLPYYIYLDEWVTIEPADMTYANKQTTFTIPFTPNTDRTMYAYSLGNDPTRGRAGVPADIDVATKTITLDGDWTGADLAFGYNYELDYQFPVNYVKKQVGEASISDTRSSLTIHRCKFQIGLQSYATFEIERFGKDTFTVEYEARPMDQYQANRPAIEMSQEVIVPIYDRNTNINLSLKTDYPGPLFLYSMNWEGDYTNRFYRSV